MSDVEEVAVNIDSGVQQGMTALTVDMKRRLDGGMSAREGV